MAILSFLVCNCERPPLDQENNVFATASLKSKRVCMFLRRIVTTKQNLEALIPQILHNVFEAIAELLAPELHRFPACNSGWGSK
jgi:hypothetical protein